MGATTVTIDAILKEKYLPPIQEAFTQGRVLLEKLDRNTEDYDGKKIVIPVNKSRNSGLGAAAENGTLPTAGNQGFVDATYTPKAVYGRVTLTGQTMRRSKTDAGAFARALDRELRGMERDLKNDVNRILNGDGSGTLATITTGAVGATQTVSSTRFMNPGDTYKVGAAVDATVSTVNSDTSVTFTASITTTTADTIKREIGTTVVSEPDGIGNAIDDSSTFGAIARSTNFFWQAKVLANGGTPRANTLALMDQLYRESEKRNNEPPDAFFAVQDQRDKYGQLLQANERFVNTTSGDGGLKVLSHKDVPFLVDFAAKTDCIFGPKWASLAIAEAGPIDWMQEDGAILSRVANLDAYEATLVYEFNVIAYNARENVRLNDLN